MIHLKKQGLSFQTHNSARASQQIQLFFCESIPHHRNALGILSTSVANKQSVVSSQ